MPPGAIIKRRDVLKDGAPRLVSRAIAVLIDEFGLERVKKALGHGVVEALARPARAGDELMRFWA